MSNGTLGDGKLKDLSFNLICATIRRDQMMKAILGQGTEKIAGQRILENVKKQVNDNKLRQAEEEDDD